MKPTDTIHINLTDDQGVFLGRISMTAGELSAARPSTSACMAVIEDIAAGAGVR